MILSILLAITAVLLMISIVADIRFRRKQVAMYENAWETYNEVRENVREFITPGTAGESSPLADLANTLCDLAGRQVASHLKASLMATESGEIRGQRAADGAMAQDLIANANPGLAALLGAFPNTKKLISKNPGATEYVLGKLAERLGKAEPVQGPGNNHRHARSSDYQAELRI